MPLPVSLSSRLRLPLIADPANLPSRAGIDIAKEINVAEWDKPDTRRWKDSWGAGHSVSGVFEILSAAELIERTATEYAAAPRSMQRVDP